MTAKDGELLDCPACGTTAVRRFPASRATSRVVGGCKACGTHLLLNPPDPGQVVANHEYDREVFQSWVEAKRQDRLDEVHEETLGRLHHMVASGGRDLFDVGAGAGEFLARAASHGFVPHGNELAPGAIELTRERLGVDLHHGDLRFVEGADRYDVVTMWCVLAHVSEQDQLLRDAFRLLKPGGVLFLQTPRWSAMDAAALAAARVSRGRVTRILDRRVNEFHMTLHSARGLQRQAERLGFEVLEARPRARYSLKTVAYLRSLGVAERPATKAARMVDQLVDRDLFFRIVIDLYARKPGRSSEK